MPKRKTTAICKCHGIEKEKEDLYRVKIVTAKSSRYEWYCSEQEYNKYKEEREYKKKYLEEVDNIFGRKVINTLLLKESSEIAKLHTYKKMYLYLHDNTYDITTYMCKNFSSEYAEIRYFMAIIKNSISDYKIKKHELENNVNKEVEHEEIQPIITSKYKKKENKKRSMLDIADELED